MCASFAQQGRVLTIDLQFALSQRMGINRAQRIRPAPCSPFHNQHLPFSQGPGGAARGLLSTDFWTR